MGGVVGGSSVVVTGGSSIVVMRVVAGVAVGVATGVAVGVVTAMVGVTTGVVVGKTTAVFVGGASVMTCTHSAENSSTMHLALFSLLGVGVASGLHVDDAGSLKQNVWFIMVVIVTGMLVLLGSGIGLD